MEHTLAQTYTEATRRLLLLDYDGTLREFCPTPEQAAPTPEIKQLLRDLAADPRNTVAVISGRDRQTLDDWLGDLPIHFVAEHGLAYRQPEKSWQLAVNPDMAWAQRVREIMETRASSVPGSIVETKPASLAWHYRTAEDDAAAEAALRALLDDLAPIAERHSLRIMQGNKVVEVAPAGIDKGSQTNRWLKPSSYDFVLAIGDDITDEDLFRALPPQAFTFKVGPNESAAAHRLSDPAEVRDLLVSLATSTQKNR